MQGQHHGLHAGYQVVRTHDVSVIDLCTGPGRQKRRRDRCPRCCQMAASIIWGPLLVGVRVTRALLFGVYIRAPDLWKLPNLVPPPTMAPRDASQACTLKICYGRFGHCHSAVISSTSGIQTPAAADSKWDFPCRGSPETLFETLLIHGDADCSTCKSSATWNKVCPNKMHQRIHLHSLPWNCVPESVGQAVVFAFDRLLPGTWQQRAVLHQVIDRGL